MPVTPFEIGREEIDDSIFVDPDGDRITLTSNWLAKAYFPVPASADEYLQHAGLILATSSASGFEGYFVPYSASLAYGAGSDTATGVLAQTVDLVWSDQGVAPVVHAKLVEARCYVLGGAKGTVPAGVKSALSQIVWA
jgi:hypothetical protein